jgi:hypothetical protein
MAPAKKGDLGSFGFYPTSIKVPRVCMLLYVYVTWLNKICIPCIPSPDFLHTAPNEEYFEG